MSFGYNPPTGFDAADDIADALRHKRAVAGHQQAQAHDTHELESVSLNIESPRDTQSGLPTGQVWDDTDIVHVVADGEAGVNMTYGDIEFDVVGRPELGDSGTHEVGHVRGVQDIEVENDETHFTERSAGPGHVRGVIQKRLPGTSAEGFQSHTQPFADGFMDYTDDSVGSGLPDAEASAVTIENCMVSSIVAPDAEAEAEAEVEGVWQDDWESPIA